MASNTLGEVLQLTTYGESHGKAIGGVLDGLPAGLEIDWDLVRREMARRKPGQSSVSTQRKEDDDFEILSGIFEGKTTGAPLSFQIKNADKRSKDYDHLKDVYRPSHADLTYDLKYGIRDHRGGGRSSARETANWVLAGAIAKQILPKELKIKGFVNQIGPFVLEKSISELDLNQVDANIVRCPDQELSSKMIAFIEKLRDQGDSVGGAVRCIATAVPAGLGAPVFSKLPARLGAALFSLNAVKGVEFGSGFKAAEMLGSQHNDEILAHHKTLTNNAGGTLGGISNGEPLDFRVAFKPTASINKEQNTISKDGENATLQSKGRHDPCVVPRAVPIVEALTAFTLADLYLMSRMDRL